MAALKGWLHQRASLAGCNSDAGEAPIFLTVAAWAALHAASGLDVPARGLLGFPAHDVAYLSERALLGCLTWVTGRVEPTCSCCIATTFILMIGVAGNEV